MADDPTTPHPLDRLLHGYWRWLHDPPRDTWVLLREDGLWLETTWAGLWDAVGEDGWRVIADAINATTAPGRHAIEVTTGTGRSVDPEDVWGASRRVVSAQLVRL